jgi:hypothetical protein
MSNGALCAGLTGCGTIFYPERIGQTHGPLDWKVVALDTVGLLLFLVPGIVSRFRCTTRRYCREK